MVQMARCIQELERIKGVRQGSAGGNGINQYNKNLLDGDNLPEANTQSDIAEELNVSQRQLRDYKKLTNLIPELQDLIESNQMKATVGTLFWYLRNEEPNSNEGEKGILFTANM